MDNPFSVQSWQATIFPSSTAGEPSPQVLATNQHELVGLPPPQNVLQSGDVEQVLVSKSKRKSKILAIVRVSTDGQTTDNQELAMKRWYADHNVNVQDVEWLRVKSGSYARAWKGYNEVMRRIAERRWDEVHLWRVDRLGRKTKRSLDMWELCRDSKGQVVMRFLDDNLRSDNDDDHDWFVMRAMYAERESRMIAKRSKEGQERAKEEARKEKRPWKCGRPKGTRNKRVESKRKTIVRMYKEWKYTVHQISQEVEVKHATIVSILAEEGVKVKLDERGGWNRGKKYPHGFSPRKTK